MIPKKIHYCWFGGKELPQSAKKCVESWKKFFPDYEIIEWNEKNFDIHFNNYAYEAYKNKKYAFFTDVARLYIIYKYGGLYFDVDVEVIKSYDDIINDCDAFFGIETLGMVNTGLGFGAVKGNKFVKLLLDDYNNKSFYNDDGTPNLVPCPVVNSVIFKKYGFKLNNSKEQINNIYIFPRDYFNVLDNNTGKVKNTSNTHSIHWYKASWVPWYVRVRILILRPIRKLLGKKYFKIKNVLNRK